MSAVFLTAPDLAGADPKIRHPVRVTLAFRWRHDMAGLAGTDADVAADVTLPTTTVEPEEHESQDPGMAGPGTTTAGALIPLCTPVTEILTRRRFSGRCAPP